VDEEETTISASRDFGAANLTHYSLPFIEEKT